MSRRAIAAAAIIGLLLVLAGCTSKPATFTVHGTLQVSEDPFDSDDAGDGTCALSSGYSDISKGAQVLVKNSANRTVAIGSLTSESANSTQTSCTFHFSVSGVPVGLKIYGVEVTHRGVIEETEKDLHKAVTLTLGS